MFFSRKFETLLRKSNDNIIKFNLDSGLNYEEFNSNGDLLHSKRISTSNFTFVDVSFDILPNDSIYGLINNKVGSLDYIFINDYMISKTILLNYDIKSFEIKFLYIKKLNKVDHILFYSINKKMNNKVCYLVHYYKENSKWIRTEVNIISFGILSNFVVDTSNSYLRVFYFKIVNDFEEIFLSTFDLERKIWISPIQITKTYKSKVYLSAIKSSSNDYHLIFSENNSNRYFCTNITLSIRDNLCTITNYINISETIACTFPHLILYKNNLYAQWIEYNDLNTSISMNWGNSWRQPKKDNFSSYSFLRYDFKSNSYKDKRHTSSTVFAQELFPYYLGLPKDYD